MNTFVEIAFKDPNTNALVKRTVNAATISAVDVDSQGRALVIMGGGSRFPVGPTNLSTYEAYADVVARLAQATPTNPTATVSAADHNKAVANQVA